MKCNQTCAANVKGVCALHQCKGILPVKNFKPASSTAARMFYELVRDMPKQKTT